MRLESVVRTAIASILYVGGVINLFIFGILALCVLLN